MSCSGGCRKEAKRAMKFPDSENDIFGVSGSRGLISIIYGALRKHFSTRISQVVDLAIWLMFFSSGKCVNTIC